MEETVYLFGNRKQFTSWMTENCGNCRRQPTGFPGCHLSAAVADAVFLEGVVPLSLAERIGYFDVSEADVPVLSHTWTCREFTEKNGPSTEAADPDGTPPPRRRPAEVAPLSRPVAVE